ncbi:hypothetical protein [Paenibacillus eucommiae]|uniref:Uncharacterized protein n=1 Tax=Paenibacillus eucommiae TaxID=1355755 RepID=A0ABS4J673_9BACL|nr:hypothetical protein [Paenibacillus eucommiae]MBP1995313.1 hypothetical protein [Paenibacillus eucommiae]
MEKEQVSAEVAIDLRKKMEQIWEINKSYWYPLNECDRHDVIAFNSEFIENKEKVNEIITLLEEHGVEQVLEFLETGQTCRINVANLHPFYCYNDDLTGGEGFWFSDKMDWIIYASHEGTITFGGKWLVEVLKSKWSDWNNHIDWDTKN